ncbi:DUF262 domain-containing protein [Kribbella sp. NBC_00482]|uniref:DUF262 domain-containing protein n=1 Tax=Kribbella sp. NBC_00482 TaxID=2975968 RepID=UPI002E192609
MSRLVVSRQTMKVSQLLRSLQTLLLDPGYQREGGIWTRDRQQLFIDSILNGFDIPPIYLHRLQPPEFRDDVASTFAVVDGRQRLEALMDFADNKYPLAPDFVLLEEVEDAQLALSEELAPPPSRYAEKRLEDLKYMSPVLAYRFLDYGMSVSVIETDDATLIEELFFRLNEGVPLTPAEKRSRGALLRELMQSLVHEEDLLRIARFGSRRRVHEDLLLRILFLVNERATIDHVPDMRKRALDDFAASLRPPLGQKWNTAQEAEARDRLERLLQEVLPALRALASIFEPSDPLLSTVNVFMVYYLVVKQLIDEGHQSPTRETFVRFTEELHSLRGAQEDELTPDQLDALEFAQPVQGSTTGSYLVKRASVLYRYMRGDLRLNS